MKFRGVLELPDSGSEGQNTSRSHEITWSSTFIETFFLENDHGFPFVSIGQTEYLKSPRKSQKCWRVKDFFRTQVLSLVKFQKRFNPLASSRLELIIRFGR